jgi:hypothetical protein
VQLPLAPTGGELCFVVLTIIIFQDSKDLREPPKTTPSVVQNPPFIVIHQKNPQNNFVYDFKTLNFASALRMKHKLLLLTHCNRLIEHRKNNIHL